MATRLSAGRSARPRNTEFNFAMICCAAIGGAALGAALFGPERDNTLWIASFLFLISPVLLLGGTCTTRRPLFLLVFLPMPVLMSAGYYLREYHLPGFWP